MTVLLLLALLLPQQDPQTYDGSKRQLQVAIPRIEASAEIDGVLDDPVWAQAARLVGFSQYQPVDGRPAEEPTEVSVWYAPDAIYFGVKATELHGDVVRATRANRDNISSEDQIQILLDTYNDRRNSFMFSVNPLGVQADGTRSDAFGGGAGGRSAMGGGSRMTNFLDGNVDLNPDFAFDSVGRVTADGFVVEIRIPFKSLRYQDTPVQNWGIHVLRRSLHSGYQDSWAPAVRANASFLGQAGELVGLHDLHRGLVLEITPTATGRLVGAESDTGPWEYTRDSEYGADVSWGIRQNLTLNGTINPDFSQVEADVGQVTLNERFALFYPEKRPFFLDGLELFDTPGRLIYTRSIVAPQAGAKLAGKIGQLNVATILAADDQAYSASGDDTPLFAVTRLRRDFGRNSTVGAVLTAREDGADFSRLAGLDTRFYHHRMYYLELQGVQSWQESGGAGTSGTKLSATWDRTGRAWGFHYSIDAVSPDFEAAAGFVNRTDLVSVRGSNRLTYYGTKEALVQTINAFTSVDRSWTWDDPGAGAIEGRVSVFPAATLRGGWRVSGSLSTQFYAYDADDYSSYEVIDAGAAQAFAVPGRETNQWAVSLGITTPTWRFLTASVNFGIGRTPLFREATPGQSRRATGTVDMRPTQALRATFQVTGLALDRRRDDSRFSTERIPRLKLEYQLTPALFVRFIGQYTSRDRAPLVDRLGRAIAIDGEVDAGTAENLIQTDWLISYRPIPGTLLYLGYGSTLEEPESFRYRNLRRQQDGFFAKASYRIRV